MVYAIIGPAIQKLKSALIVASPDFQAGLAGSINPCAMAKTNPLGRAIQKKPAIGGQSSKGRLQIPARLPNLRTKQPAIGDKGPSITQWLEDMLQDKLRTAVWKKGQLFVDLASGKRSQVGRQVGKRGGAFIAFDVLIDARFDFVL